MLLNVHVSVATDLRSVTREQMTCECSEEIAWYILIWTYAICICPVDTGPVNGPRHAKKSAFKHAQNVWIHIILYVRKVLSGQLLSIETFHSIQWLCLRTAKAQIRLYIHAGWSGPSLSACARRHVFAWRDPNNISNDILPLCLWLIASFLDLYWFLLKTVVFRQDQKFV